MNVDIECDPSGQPKEQSKKRRYIPHLAKFYFRPTYDWSIEDARSLYKHASHRIGHLELDSVYFEDCIIGMTQLPSGSVDLVIADPPFGIDFDGKSGVYNRDSSLVIEGYGEVSESYEVFTQNWLREISRVLNKTGSAYVFSGWTHLEFVLAAARIAGLRLLNHLVWHYSFGVFTKKKFVTSHYHILLLVKSFDDYLFNKIENYPQDVWILNRQYHSGRTKNGTKLPMDLVQRCIDYSSRPGDIVLDPFMGNGTTAVAAKSSFRHFIGFEINPNLQPIIDDAVSQIVPGEKYIPYSERLPTIEELARQYPSAYKEYLRREELPHKGGELVDGR